MQNFKSFDRKKKVKKKVYLTIGIIVGIMIYALFHFLQLYSEFKDEYVISRILMAVPKHMVMHPIEIMAALKTYGLLVTAAVMLIGVLIYAKSEDQKAKKHDDPSTVNGAARWMTHDDYESYCKRYTAPYGSPEINSNQNIILSQDIMLGIDGHATRRNLNVLCIGGSGAGKSRFFAAPNILQYNTNFIITDPSGELLSDYGKSLQDHGYMVKVFNISDMYASSRYNPFHYLKKEQDALIFVDTLMKNINGDEKPADPFWSDAEKLLLYSIVLYLWHKVPESEQTLANVFKLINLANVDENRPDAKSALDKLMEDFEKEDPDNFALEEYRGFKKAAGKTLKSIIITAVTTMKDFRLSDISYLLSTDELELEKFADQKQAMFVVIPTGVKTFNYLVSLMYSQLFMELYDYAEKYAEYGYLVLDGDGEVLRTFRCKEKNNSKATMRKAKKWIKDVKKHGMVIVENKKEKLFEIRDSKTNELISWRGDDAKMAEAYMLSLLKMKIKKCDRACPIQVSMILDEFANIGQIPDFDTKLSTIRKYKINTFIILQSLSQIKALYDKQWNTLIGNCDTKIDLGTDDQETNEYFVKDAGNRTTKTANESFQEGGQGGGSTSISAGKTELITQDLLKNMKEDECIVMIRGIRPYCGKKYELTNHPNYESAHATAGSFHITPPEDFKMPISNIPFRLRKKPDEKDMTMYYDGKFGDPESFSPVPPDPEEKADTDNMARKKNAMAPKQGYDSENKEINDIKSFFDTHDINETITDIEIKTKAAEEIEKITFADPS